MVCRIDAGLFVISSGIYFQTGRLLERPGIKMKSTEGIQERYISTVAEVRAYSFGVLGNGTVYRG